MTMAATKTLRVAVIGTGYFSRFHYAAWQRMPDVELVGLVTLDQSEALNFQNEYGVDTIYPDLTSMLEQSDANLIDLVTPPHTHAAFIRQCVDKNLNVICQKPFCGSYSEAVTTVDYIKQRDGFVVVHENFRFQPWYQQIKHIIMSDQLGQIFEVNFDFRPGDGQGPEAYLDRQPYFQTQKRFFIQETGIHFVDVFRYLLGDVEGLFARLKKLNPVIAGEDAGVVLMDFACGARGILNGNRLSDHAADNTRRTMGEMRVHGSRATLTLNGDGRIQLREHGSSHWIEHQFEWQDIDFGGDCVFNTSRHIADHLLEGTPVQNQAEAYLINRQIEDAIYQSNNTGMWMPID